VPFLVGVASVVVFLVNFKSLMQTSHLGRLIAVLVAPAMFLSVARAMYTGIGKSPVVFTICFLFVMGGAAAIAASSCEDHTLRVVFAVIALVLVIADAVYSVCSFRRRSQGGGALP